MTDAPYHIVFPIFSGVTQLDFAGPAQFLSRLPHAQVQVVAARPDPVVTDSGFAILPNAGFDDCPQARLLCVPGGLGVADALGDGALIDFIARQAASADYVTSVCTEAFLLGRAGFLKGRRATTHWGYTQLLPLVGAIHADERVVIDGNVITAGGVTSGIDFALRVIAEVAGERTARAVQLVLEYDPAPPFAGGHPRSSGAALTGWLRERVYDDAAQRMERALER
ncbi:DJ-1/PfpI family protein [Novosphingopyxis sp.]|uniref:DJ-1/PfpI family protein n=1 Tax=Novosphingopyxis sp. TaxID=2709690 RepID=UPI003B59A28D